MAETLKILSPEKEVVLSHPDAGCPMAEQINPKEVEAYRKAHPDHGICAYVNTTAELKALADVCVTSSSAVSIVRKLPYQDILFLPDKKFRLLCGRCRARKKHPPDERLLSGT